MVNPAEVFVGCFLLIPKWDSRFSNEFGECVLPSGHDGYHLNKLNNGNYLSWGGEGCDENCEWCGECYCWIELKESEAAEIIADPKKNNHD